MKDLMHYIRRPSMPLPTEVLEAAGLDPRLVGRSYTWTTLTDTERDDLLALFPPTVAIAGALLPSVQLIAVASGESTARAAVERAWKAHAEDTDDDPGYPIDQATSVLTGPIGTVWRDGAVFPKGDN